MWTLLFIPELDEEILRMLLPIAKVFLGADGFAYTIIVNNRHDPSILRIRRLVMVFYVDSDVQSPSYFHWDGRKVVIMPLTEEYSGFYTYFFQALSNEPNDPNYVYDCYYQNVVGNLSEFARANYYHILNQHVPEDVYHPVQPMSEEEMRFERAPSPEY
eukprot:754549-Hanusia_phi.AAC.4